MGRACGVAKSSHWSRRRRQFLLDGLHELLDEVEIGLAGHALVPPADVFRRGQSFRVVGADVQDDRQRPRRMDTADQRVERQLADGDAHAAGALIADAEDALAVGDDDDVHLRVGTVPQAACRYPARSG